MSRYIDADTIDYKHFLQHVDGEFNFELLDGADNLIDAFYAGFMYLHNMIEETPTADVRENKRGRWQPIQKGDSGYSAGDFACSCCGKPNRCYSLTDYCCNCGADMRGEEDEIQGKK